MIIRVSVTEFRNNLAEYLRKAKYEGMEFEVWNKRREERVGVFRLEEKKRIGVKGRERILNKAFGLWRGKKIDSVKWVRELRQKEDARVSA